MKYAILFAVCFAVGLNAAVVAPRSDVEIVRQNADVQPEGFNFVFQTSDGTAHEAEGQLKNLGTDHEAIVVQGSYAYVGDDGVTYNIKYIADENGFQPQGAHIPQP